MKARYLTSLAALALTAVIGTAPASAAVSVGFLYVGAKTDGGYNEAQDAGRLYLQQHVAGVKTNYLENVPENAQVMQAMERMINAGDTVIFATSYGYLPYALKVAAKYPKVTFMHCGGARRASNLGTYFADMFQAMYLSGIAAGKAASDGKIGFVAAHPIPQILQDINAIELGAQSVNPKATVTVVYTGAWNDPAKDVAAVNTLVGQGVKVIGMHVDSPIPVIEAARKQGVKVIGYHFDDMRFDPKGWLTGGYWNWGPTMAQTVKEVEAGTWKSQALYGNLATGAAKLAPFGPSVDAATRKLILEKEKAIEGGKLDVWAGPMHDQQGKLVVAAGSKLPRARVDAMDFFVQGVVGSLK